MKSGRRRCVHLRCNTSTHPRRIVSRNNPSVGILTTAKARLQKPCLCIVFLQYFSLDHILIHLAHQLVGEKGLFHDHLVQHPSVLVAADGGIRVGIVQRRVDGQRHEKDREQVIGMLNRAVGIAIRTRQR